MNNVVHLIDCMEFMKTVPDKYYELAIVDPPYGIGMGGGLVGNSKTDYKQFSGEDKHIPNKKILFRVSRNQIMGKLYRASVSYKLG